MIVRCASLCTALRGRGTRSLISTVPLPPAGVERGPPPALLFTDVRMPGDDGLVLLDKLKAALPQLPVVVMSAYTDVASTAGAFRGGAHEFLSKPFDLDDAVALARRVLPAVAPALAAPARRRNARRPSRHLVGDTPMGALFRHRSPGAAPLAVLITGETGAAGAGVANAQNRRVRRAFVALNTAAIPAELLESSCSATKLAPSPVRSAVVIGTLRAGPTAARCSWMRSATCRCRCRPACCVCWRRVSSSASVTAG